MTLVRSAAARLAAGSAALVRRFLDWLGPGDLREAAQRIAWATFCAFILGSVIVAAPGLMWWLACGWCGAAVYASRPQPTAESEEHGEGVLDVDELVAALHEVAAPHVHLVPLAEHLDTTTTVVRTALHEAGIEVAAGVRMDGRGVSTGVRAADIPPLPHGQEGTPSECVVAGQPDNSNSNSVTVELIGQGCVIVRDPAELARKHTVRKDTH